MIGAMTWLALLLAVTTASATPVPLPEIGRVRAISPACSALRDLIIPSFTAARRADVTFATTTKDLQRYVEVVDDEGLRNSGFHQKAAFDLGRDAANLRESLLVVSRALGDPRLAPSVTDPTIRIQRTQLEQVYAVQAGRAGILDEFIARENKDVARARVDRDPLYRGGELAPGGRAMPTDPPHAMPRLTGLAFGDKQAIREWADGMTSEVRSAEDDAAKALLPTAETCR